MSRKSFALASAAAALFVAGVAVPALAAEEGKVKCEGVNSCKGHSDCKTATGQCAGKNSCKGKGFLMLTPEECDAAKAKLAEEQKK
jgi:hypothetical protein